MVTLCVEMMTGSHDELMKTFTQLGKAHSRIGIYAHQYGAFVEVLLQTLDEVLGPEQFPAKVRHSWEKALSRVLEILVPVAVEDKMVRRFPSSQTETVSDDMHTRHNRHRQGRPGDDDNDSDNNDDNDHYYESKRNDHEEGRDLREAIVKRTADDSDGRQQPASTRGDRNSVSSVVSPDASIHVAFFTDGIKSVSDKLNTFKRAASVNFGALATDSPLSTALSRNNGTPDAVIADGPGAALRGRGIMSDEEWGSTTSYYATTGMLQQSTGQPLYFK
jgi:hypothetical protein